MKQGFVIPINLTFKKNGKEIKKAIANRVSQLNSRLEKRNQTLDELTNDRPRLRSYLVRNSDVGWGMHGGNGPAALYTKDDISSEEVGEIRQLCRRILEIEQELKRLYLTKEHLRDDQEFTLPFGDLVAYGFEVGMYTE